MNKEDVRILFLTEFTLRLIENAHLLRQTKERTIPIPATREIPRQEAVEIVIPKIIAPPKKEIAKPKVQEISEEIESSLIVPSPETKKAEDAKEKLESLIKDSSIQSIECPGPDKNILIKKDNKVEPVALILSADEIKSFLKKTSEKTNTPLEEGIFRAKLDSSAITAIVSEFVGSKFVIQKQNPTFV